MLKKIPVVILVFLLFVTVVHATFTNPKSVESVIVKLTQSGRITISGYVSRMNLTIYIPQEGIQNIDVQPTNPDNWKYTQDAFGNKQILFQWTNPPEVIDYSIATVVRNNAKYLEREKNIGSTSEFLKETSQIVFNDDIRKIAYPYEKNLKGAVELSAWVNDYVEYDSSYAGKRLPSDKVLQERRGVCVEHANLLTSLLRVSGIPTKYITGYAYSTLDKKFIGHTWVEVIADDNSNVGMDPTWDEAGYVDATHIKTGEMLDDNQSEVLMFLGNGNVDWKRNDEEFQILDYTEKPPVEISAEDGTFASNGYGFLKASITDGCMLNEISVNSCVDEQNTQMISVYEPQRKIWSCGEREAYWFFKPKIGERSYICPLTIYDQSGSKATARIEIDNEKPINEVFIAGPDSVGVNENFQLESSADLDFIFYSPTLEEKNNGKTWDLNLKKPGAYKFYLYSGGSLATKLVNVLEKNEYSITANAPRNATLGSSFLVMVSVKSLMDTPSSGKITLYFDGTTFEKDFNIAPKTTYDTVFNITTHSTGMKKISVSALGNNIATYSTQILIYEHKERSIFDDIADFFSGIFKAISDFFTGLFSG